MLFVLMLCYLFFFLSIRRPPRSTRTDTLFPYTTLFRSYCAIVEAIDGARNRVGALLRPHDPLVDNALARAVKSPAEARTQLAVASAVRILSEREAAWPVHKLGKTALDLGLKGVTVESIERRIARLVQNRQLIPGIDTAAGRHGRRATHQETLLETERRVGKE